MSAKYLPRPCCTECGGTGEVAVVSVCCGPNNLRKDCGCSSEGLVLDGHRLCDCTSRVYTTRLKFKVCGACRGHGGGSAGGEWRNCEWCLGYGKRLA